MLAKSEVVLLTVAVLGTLAAWLTGRHPSLVRLSHDAPSIACSVPASAFRGVRPSFERAQALFDQVPLIFPSVL
jgi:hypothetical protein